MLYDRKLEKVKMLGSLLNSSKTETEVAKVLLVGSNASVEIFLREIVLNEEISYNFEPVGILTLDQLDIGHIIRGVPILGELRDIHSVLKELHKDGSLPRQIVITEKAIPENAKKFLIKYANDRKLLLMQIVHQCTFNAVA
jgi:O-antigen biosynthesis protein WbqV